MFDQVFTRNRARTATAAITVRRNLGRLALAAALACGPAMAQESPPAEETSDLPTVARTPIESGAIGALDLWSAPGRATALPADLWQGTSARQARAMLARIGTRPLSPAMHRLAADLLATGARAPDGGGDDESLAAERIAALIRLGESEAALSLLARTPGVETSETLSRARAEAWLWQGDTARACESARALTRDREAPFQLRLRAFCHAIAAEAMQAEVTYGLWQASGESDANYVRLMGQVLAGTTEGRGAGAADTALNHALSRHLGLDAPSDLPEGHPLRARAAAIAAVPRPPLPPPPAAAAPVNGASAPSPDDLPTPLDDNARRDEQHRLWASAIETALEAASGDTDLLRRTARANRQGMGELISRGTPFQQPLRIVTALVLAGEPAAAQALLATTLEGSPFDLAMADALVTASGVGSIAASLDRLIERGEAGDPALRPRARQAALLLFALGAEATPDARARLLGFEFPAPRAGAGQLLGMGRAAGEDRAGEAALIALDLALEGPLTIPERALVVRTLAEAGLTAHARDVAIEGLIAIQRGGTRP